MELKNKGIKPQYVLFSATIDEATLENIVMFINDPIPKAFTLLKKVLKLDNVKQLRMRANEQEKR